MKDKIQYQIGFVLPLALSIREKVVAFLATAGFDLVSLVEEEDRKARKLGVFVADRKQADKIFVLFKSLGVSGVKPFLRVHRQSEWASSWKKGWKPFSLTRKLQVIPLWQRKRSCPAGKVPVLLDTTNAFGTGLHETTRFTAQMIEGLTGRFNSFLDVGTGSGILAIVALKCQAKRCVAFDIDASAVSVARQNLQANGLMCTLKTCDVKKFRPARLFDLVAANLVSHDLIEYRDRLLSLVRPGGHLVISGISVNNISRVKKAFAQAGIYPVKLRKGREWSAMLFKI